MNIQTIWKLHLFTYHVYGGNTISKGVIFRRRVSTGAILSIRLMVIFLFHNKTACQYLVYKFTFCFYKEKSAALITVSHSMI